MKRIVSVWLENFALDRLRWQWSRSGGHVSGSPQVEARGENLPFALVAKEANGVRITAANRPAQKGGIHEGMRLADAHALLPSLETEIADTAADARVLEALADWCERYTPTVGIDGVDGLWLDITGAAHLVGSEQELLADLSRRLRAIGFANRLGLAETPGAAWAIARFGTAGGRHQACVPPGGVDQALAPLPPAALRLGDEALYLLKRFGLKTIGALCAIPRASLQRRFPSREIGEAVLHRLDQALGTAPEPIVTARKAPVYFERLSFPEPILATESFQHGFHELLSRLCRSLEGDHKGATQLTFSAFRADGGVSRMTVMTARPSRDEAHLALLFRDRIEAIDPGFGVDVLVLSADRGAPLEREQLRLAGRRGARRNEADVSALIDRLTNRLGPARVQRIAFRESHIPERAETRVPALRKMAAGAALSCPKPSRPFRLLTRPEPVQVMAEVPEGPPMRFSWRRVMYRVIRAEGPERIAPEWWCELSAQPGKAGRTRDYYRVEDEEGRRFWLFRDGLYRDLEKGDGAPLPTWHICGLFG